MESIVFYIIALLMVTFAMMSVSSRNIMRSIVYLLFVMLGLSGVYFMLEFNFLGAVQLVVYAGGVIILYITSIMLIEKIGESLDKPKILQQIIAAVITSLGAGATLFAIYSYDFNVVANINNVTSVEDIGFALLDYGDNGYILPFEIISMLLLAAMVGAIVIAKSGKSSNPKELKN